MDWWVGVVASVVAGIALVLAFDVGRSSVLQDCENYGRAKINRTMLVCSGVK